MLNAHLHINQYWKVFLSAVRYHSFHNGETYYDILRVRNDCSNQEIRNSFVELSKMYHPDVKGTKSDPKETAQFVKISEAYQILSKPQTRSEYDQRLCLSGELRTGETSGSSAERNMRTTELHRPWEIKPDFDPNPGPYYGFNGLERVSNLKVALALALLGIAGAMVGYLSVNHSATFNRQQLDVKSAEAGTYLAGIRADAEKYGNEEQLKRMMERMSKEDRFT